MKALIVMAAGGIWGLVMVGMYDDPPLLNIIVGAVMTGFIVRYFADKLD